MVDILNGTAGTEGEAQLTRELQPVLFIGLGGTGLEVILRVRRRILHAGWGRDGEVRLASLEDFPVAEFLHFDLDRNALLEGNRSAADDPLADLVKLPQQDRIVTSFDQMKYLRSREDMDKYPAVAAWCPLTGEIAGGLNLENGAGQLRAVSRLYFFDVYPTVRSTILQKLNNLKANRSNAAQLKRLGLTVDNARVRIVVVGSCAGGTGSGVFLDFGWLARLLAAKTFGGGNYDVQLYLFSPRGYEMANADRTKANGYAALMELETCMKGFPDYVGRWEAEEPLQLDPVPFTDAYIVESANMGRDALKDVQDVYEMTADALFEDLASEDFANCKRSASANQKQHKAMPYTPPLPSEFAPIMRLSYSMAYSAFGQATMDTKLAQQDAEDEYALAAAMLEAFFGIASTDGKALEATDKNRDDFLAEHLKLGEYTFSRFPDFGRRSELQDLCHPFVDNRLTLDLLRDDRGGIEEALQQRINAMVETVKADQASIRDWGRLLRERIPALEQDVIRNQDTTTLTCEERIAGRARVLLDRKFAVLKAKLYEYLDNRDYGGLEYVLSLAELINAAILNPTTGLAARLEENAVRYRRIRDALKTEQIEETLGNIAGAVKGGFFGGPDAKKAAMYMEDLKEDLGDYLSFHARGVAADAGAALLRELTGLIGGRHGTDDADRTVFTGLLAEFEAGRREVKAVSREIVHTAEAIEDGKDKRHANYVYIRAARPPAVTPDRGQLRDWAEEAFKDFEGSQRIFPMLRTAEGKAKLLNKLRIRAAAALRAQRREAARDRRDPLVLALLDMEPAARLSTFAEFLRAAMPWIDANFADVPLKPDRFKCFMGVRDPEEWKPLLEELESSIPTYAGITATQFQLKRTGIPGRAVCYCELSGFPLCVLNGLSDWRAKYRLERRSWPLHTHKDPTRFVHPMVPTPAELKQEAADIRLFLLGVMLRRLVRNPKTTTPPGLYALNFGRGDWKSLGNERAFRLDGLPAEYRVQLEKDVQAALAGLDGLQLYALSLLAEYLEQETYAAAVSTTESGKDEDRPGFAHGVAALLSAELAAAAAAAGFPAPGEDKKAVGARLADWGEWEDITRSFDAWTEVIAGSEHDAPPQEVRESLENGEDRRKRRVVRNFFAPGWLHALVAAPQPAVQTAVQPGMQPGMQVVPPPVPPAGPAAVPPPLSPKSWWVAMGMRQTGPYDWDALRALVAGGQMTVSSRVWTPGMPDWATAGGVPELAGLFATPPPLGLRPPPLRS